VSLTVAAVNDAPTLVLATNQVVVLETAGRWSSPTLP